MLPKTALVFSLLPLLLLAQKQMALPRGSLALTHLQDQEGAIASLSSQMFKSSYEVEAMFIQDSTMVLDPCPTDNTTCVPRVLFIDDHLPPVPIPPRSPGPLPYNASRRATVSAFTLHSKPKVTRVLYLDFNGHNLAGSAWGALYAPPCDWDGKPGSFSAAEQANIKLIWQRVSEDFAPFEIE